MTNLLELPKKELKALVLRNRENGYEDLTPQLRMFAFSFVEDYNHRRAAEFVDLPASRGIGLIRDPLVSALINDIQSELEERSILSTDFVRTMWLQILPKLLGEEAIPLVDKDGIESTALKFHASESVRALTEIGKATKFYDEGSGSTGTVINLNFGSVGVRDDGTIDITPEAEVKVQ